MSNNTICEKQHNIHTLIQYEYPTFKCDVVLFVFEDLEGTKTTKLINHQSETRGTMAIFWWCEK